MSGDRLGKTLKPPPLKAKSMKEKGYVQMWVLQATREQLHSLKRGKDTLETVLEMLLAIYNLDKIADYAAQNIDDRKEEL